MASKVTITSDTKNAFTKNQASIIRNLSERHLEVISSESARTMREKISEGLVRPDSTGNTANTIQAERVSLGHWGVGNISKLDSEAPGWAVLNYGSTHMLGRPMPQGRGDFQPGEQVPSRDSFRSGRWISSGTGKYWPKVTREVIGIDYIEKTLFQQNQIISNALRNVKINGK